MDNQHRMIKGYRELSEAEIALMNEIKEEGVRLGQLCAKVAALNPRLETQNLQDLVRHRPPRRLTADGKTLDAEGAVWTDPRWLAFAQADLQKGIMFLTRSVARPEFF